MDRTDETRRSWNLATRNHNAHKGDQAALLRGGAELLFEEELALLGELRGRSLVHLQCNAGQDSLCLARRGAFVTGVDLADEAIAFAQRLSAESGIPATFVQSELVRWLDGTADRFELAFTSYGSTGWLPDLDAWARGVHRVLLPGGALVYVEFHPVLWSVGTTAPFTLSGDDYFEEAAFLEPVGDYVAESGASLGAVAQGETVDNEIPAASYQHGLGRTLDALARAGFVLERLIEWPYANGCRVRKDLVPLPGRRWGWPPGTARLPLMYGLRARRAE